MNKQIMILTTVLLAWMLPTESTEAGDKPFPKRVPALIGAAPEGVYVVTLSKDMLSGELSEFITDPDLDGVASGAIFGSSLYVNNARYSNFPASPTEYWVTKLNISKKK